MKRLIIIAVALLTLTVSLNFISEAKCASQYSIEQAISDKAQLNTIAFSGLGFLTGNLCSDSFLPPGKVADFFGFQYLRDVTQSGQGHSTDFLTNGANNVLYILNAQQKALMLDAAKNQTAIVNQYAYARYPLMVAFRRQLDGTLPAGSSGLSKEAVKNYSADLFELDANVSIQRAKLYITIVNSLNDTQKQYLTNMITGGFASWPALPDQLNKTSMSHDENVLVMTFASDILSWYGGNVEWDTYFCPERHADYFGGFYIKDAPAIGNPGYTINETITGEEGASFIAALDSTQKPYITNLVNANRNNLTELVNVRRAIATEFRNALNTGVINQTKIILLDRQYGELDGEISYRCAMAFAQVGKTLTVTQKTNLITIKNSNYTADDSKIYLYSSLIAKPSIQNTDFLFAIGNTATQTPSATSTPSPNQTQNPASPTPTVDEYPLWAILLFSSILGLLTAVVYRKNHSKQPYFL